MVSHDYFYFKAINLGSCDLGSSLASKVDVFLGLAGGNYGLCSCQDAAANLEATCNKKVGRGRAKSGDDHCSSPAISWRGRDCAMR